MPLRTTSAHLLRSSRRRSAGRGPPESRTLSRAERTPENRLTRSGLIRTRWAWTRLTRSGWRSRAALLNASQQLRIRRHNWARSRLSGHRRPGTLRLLRTARTRRSTDRLALLRPRRQLGTGNRRPRCTRRRRWPGSPWQRWRTGTSFGARSICGFGRRGRTLWGRLTRLGRKDWDIAARHRRSRLLLRLLRNARTRGSRQRLRWSRNGGAGRLGRSRSYNRRRRRRGRRCGGRYMLMARRWAQWTGC